MRAILVPAIDARLLSSLAETLSLMLHDASEEADAAVAKKDFEAAWKAIGRSEGIREAADLLIDLVKREIA